MLYHRLPTVTNSADAPISPLYLRGAVMGKDVLSVVHSGNLRQLLFMIIILSLGADISFCRTITPVSYTHLTLPTIYSV